jgi:hypothetical protein
LSKVYFVVTVLYFDLWLLTKCFTCSQTLRWLCFLSFFLFYLFSCVIKKKIVLAFPDIFYTFSQHPGKSDAASSEAPTYEMLCIYSE